MSSHWSLCARQEKESTSDAHTRATFPTPRIQEQKDSDAPLHDPAEARRVVGVGLPHGRQLVPLQVAAEPQHPGPRRVALRVRPLARLQALRSSMVRGGDRAGADQRASTLSDSTGNCQSSVDVKASV